VGTPLILVGAGKLPLYPLIAGQHEFFALAIIFLGLPSLQREIMLSFPLIETLLIVYHSL